MGARDRWLAAHGAEGWASCPITQNGFLRVMSSPGYPNARSPLEVAGAVPAQLVAL